MTTPTANPYKRHRFPAEIISHCVWLYFRFCLSYRDVEEMMAERGIRLTNEAVRYWCRKFGVTLLLWKPGLALGAVVIAGLALKLIADQTGAFRFQSTGNQVLIAQTWYQVKLDRGLQLLGYDISSPILRPGDPLTLTMYGKALVAMPFNYNVYIHLIGPDDQLYAQSDKLNPADFPTSRWPTTKYVWDEHQLVFQQPLTPGEYRIVVGLWRKDSADPNDPGERPQPVAPDETFAEGLVLQRASLCNLSLPLLLYCIFTSASARAARRDSSKFSRRS